MFNFNFLKLFSSGRRRALGLEIGTTTIKIVELVKDKANRISLENYGLLNNYGHLERINDAFQTSSLRLMEEDVSHYIRKLVERARFKTRDVGMTLPVYSTFVTVFEMPPMPDKELKKAVPFQARQVVPSPFSEVVIDWIKIEPSHEEILYRKLNNSLIFLIAVSKDVIARYRRIAQGASLNLVSLELETLSQGRAVLGNDKVPTFILDLGSRVTNFSIFDNGFLRMNKFFDLASGEITQAIANGLRVSVWKAEEIKKRNGLKSEGGEIEIPNLIYPILDAIINEARKLISLYQERTGRKIEKVILAGSSSRMPGLLEYLSKEMPEVVVSQANAFARINYADDWLPIIKGIQSSFGPVNGIASKILLE